MAVAAAAATVAISSPVAPDRDDAPGLLSRLLQRTVVTPKTSKRFSRRSSAGSVVALKESLLNEADKGPLVPARSRIPEVAADHQESRSTAPDASDIAQPQQSHQTKPPYRDMPSATPQPQLKKKASFRDRLKAWQKPPQPLEIVTEEPKPRFVYEPTHAAADFSRLAVSPLSPSKPRPLPTTTHVPPGRDVPSAVGDGGTRPGHGGEPRDHDPTRRNSRPSVNRHSYTVVEDPFQASNAAAHVPVNSQPVAWSPGAPAANAREKLPSPQSSTKTLSDFELFLARAEAEDRERREQVLRSISQRSAAYAANRVRPDPHHQFAAAGSSAAERKAERPAEKSERSAQRNTKTRYVHASASRTEAEQQQQQPQGLKQRQDSGHRGHARQSSWAASCTTSGSATEKGLAERGTPLPAAAPPPTVQTRLPESPHLVQREEPCEDTDRAREYQPQPPRTLRRQASITQRIVQYIRPPKTGARPIQTLAE